MKGRKNRAGGFSPYPMSFRIHVVQDYLDGDLSYSQIAKKYDLPSRDTVGGWVRLYRKNCDIVAKDLPPMTEEEKKNKKALEKRILELENQLESEKLRTLGLETLIDVAEEDLGIDIRKKPGTKQLKD